MHFVSKSTSLPFQTLNIDQRMPRSVLYDSLKTNQTEKMPRFAESSCRFAAFVKQLLIK